MNKRKDSQRTKENIIKNESQYIPIIADKIAMRDNYLGMKLVWRTLIIGLGFTIAVILIIVIINIL